MERIFFTYFLCCCLSCAIGKADNDNKYNYSFQEAKVPLANTPNSTNTDITSFGTFDLQQSYPNPSSDAVSIPFHLNQYSSVLLVLYDISGKTQQIIIDNDMLNEGDYIQPINVTNLIPGVYIYRMIVAGQQKSKKIFVVK